GIAASLVVLAPPTASSAFAGQNGKLVFGTLHAGEDELWTMNADGSDRRNLTRHDGRKISDIDPRWSPDGRRIAYSTDATDVEGAGRQIWIMRADGSGIRQLTHLPGYSRSPSWTADGQQIVFDNYNAGALDVYRVDEDGTGLVNLTSNDPGVDYSPAASPRGKKIVFTSERDGGTHLYVQTPDGAAQRITSGSGSDFHANWSPRGNDIVFVRADSAGSTDLYVVHTDGTGEQRLTSTSRDEYFPAFSPDGNKVAYIACGPAPVPWAPRCAIHILDFATAADRDLSFPDLALPNPYLDGFDDNVRDVNVWQQLHDGLGGYLAETNGRLELTIDAPDAPGEFVSSRVDFHCVLQGDFDAQADYTLLSWPPVNGVNVQLHLFLDDATLARQSQPWGEDYAAWSPSGSAAAPTTDTAGSLRLVRTGGMLRSYYRQAGAWILLNTTSAAGGNALLTLEASSYGTYSGQRVRVAFDNFRIDAADRDCSSFRPDVHPDWQPLGSG
ncbi:MAG: TolB family protein, partial [Gaiellaceae bacterium]